MISKVQGFSYVNENNTQILNTKRSVIKNSAENVAFTGAGQKASKGITSAVKSFFKEYLFPVEVSDNNRKNILNIIDIMQNCAKKELNEINDTVHTTNITRKIGTATTLQTVLNKTIGIGDKVSLYQDLGNQYIKTTYFDYKESFPRFKFALCEKAKVKGEPDKSLAEVFMKQFPVSLNKDNNLQFQNSMKPEERENANKIMEFYLPMLLKSINM